MSNPKQLEFHVGNWRVEPEYCRISLDGKETHLQARWMSVLVYLAQNNDRVISADEIIDKVWGDIQVTQDSVYLNVSYLRKALAEDPEIEEYIETIPKRGYRLAAPVVFPELEDAASSRKNKLLIAGMLSLAIIAVIWIAITRQANETTVPPIPNSIAVLPFTDLESGKGSNLSVLFADDLMNQLATVDGLEVMARTSSFPWMSETRQRRRSVNN